MREHSRVEIRDPVAASSRLRIAVTEICNLRCFFCHGDGGRVRHFSTGNSDHSPAELAAVAAVGASQGATHIKLTGGEPLLYRYQESRIHDVVTKVVGACGCWPVDVSMVSNGTLLNAETARQLADAGLDRITISLHAANATTFSKYAHPRQADTFEKVISGIRNAVDAGLGPVKLNSVIYYSRRDESLRNVDQMNQILELGGQLGVDEVKFFVVLPNPNLSTKQYLDTAISWDDPIFRVFYDEDLSSTLMDALGDDEMANAVFPGSFRVRFQLNSADGPTPEFAFQNFLSSRPAAVSKAHQHLHPRACNCQEGSYALRFLPSGHLKACLWDKHDRNLVAALRKGDQAEAERIYRSAQSALHVTQAEVIVA